MNKFQLFDRSGRPALRWAGILFLAAIGSAIAAAYWRAALTGNDVPNMLGGTGPVLLLIVPQAIDLITRYLQRSQEITYGREPGVRLPNPHGGPSAP